MAIMEQHIGFCARRSRTVEWVIAAAAARDVVFTFTHHVGSAGPLLRHGDRGVARRGAPRAAFSRSSTNMFRGGGPELKVEMTVDEWLMKSNLERFAAGFRNAGRL